MLNRRMSTRPWHCIAEIQQDSQILCHLTLSFCRGPGHWENGTCTNCGASRNCDLSDLGHASVGQCPTCGVINGGYFEIGEGGGAPGIGW